MSEVMRRFCLTAAFILIATAAFARLPVEVVDGDTIRVQGQAVRIVGLDAPEMHGQCSAERELAQRATRRLQELVRDGVTLRPHGHDRYGRVLATVQDKTGQDVALVLIREGLARPYDGRGRRAGWC